MVFITRSDIFKERKTIYHLDISTRKTRRPVSDRVYRIFANCVVDDGSDIPGVMQYPKNAKGENNKFPRLSERARDFRESQDGADSISDAFEKYLRKRMAEHDEETARSLL